MTLFLAKRSNTKAHLDADKELESHMTTVNQVIKHLDSSSHAKLLRKTPTSMTRENSKPATKQKIVNDH